MLADSWREPYDLQSYFERMQKLCTALAFFTLAIPAAACLPPSHPPRLKVRAAALRHAHDWKTEFEGLGDQVEMHVSPCRANADAVECRVRMVIVDDDPPTVCSYVYRGFYAPDGIVHLHLLPGGGCVASFPTSPRASRLPARST